MLLLQLCCDICSVLMTKPHSTTWSDLSMYSDCSNQKSLMALVIVFWSIYMLQFRYFCETSCGQITDMMSILACTDLVLHALTCYYICYYYMWWPIFHQEMQDKNKPGNVKPCHGPVRPDLIISDLIWSYMLWPSSTFHVLVLHFLICTCSTHLDTTCPSLYCVVYFCTDVTHMREV